jgi:hypothetical protein
MISTISSGVASIPAGERLDPSNPNANADRIRGDARLPFMYEAELMVPDGGLRCCSPDLGEIRARQSRRSTRSARAPWFGNISKYLEIEVFRAR